LLVEHRQYERNPMRGREMELGSVRVAKNGYSYTKVMDPKTNKEKWRLTHHIIAEEQILKRPLADDERVAFIGSMRDLSIKNIVVKKKDPQPLQKKINMLNDRIMDLTDRRDALVATQKNNERNKKLGKLS
jgi:hypothetical protein